MMSIQPFCSDVQLLNWEPNIFRDAAFASQTLLSGTGTLSGTTFTIASGSFADAGVAADHVITLGGDADGCYRVVSIDSPTAITLSVINETDEADDAYPLSAAGSLSFTIRTFWPQRAIVSELIASAADVTSVDRVLNRDVLARPCALGTFQLIYAALAAVADDDRASQRADFYERLYRRALRNITVELDTDGDGRLDERRTLSVLRFQRG
jgi:hypothetical protein